MVRSTVPSSYEWPHHVLDPNQSAKAKAGSQPIKSLEFNRTVRVGHSLSVTLTTVSLFSTEDLEDHLTGNAEREKTTYYLNQCV